MNRKVLPGLLLLLCLCLCSGCAVWSTLVWGAQVITRIDDAGRVLFMGEQEPEDEAEPGQEDGDEGATK